MGLIEFIQTNIGAEEFFRFKGVHAIHPILPDDTLCNIAISDNFHHLKTKIPKLKKVTCPDCIAIINFCKKLK